MLAERSGRFAELQEMLYANGKEGDRRSLLLVLQGMDTAGKGGIVTHVVGAGNPMGIRYTSFGKPTPEERSHHFLWRINKALPPAGHIGVFDRSHYEDVLVVRVHELVPPTKSTIATARSTPSRKELIESGTTVVKAAMFVSLDEQKRRLAERLDRPENIGVQPGDLDERAVAGLPGGLSGDAGPDRDRRRTLVRGAVRQEVVRTPGDHRTAYRSAEQDEPVVAAGRLRRRRREETARESLNRRAISPDQGELADVGDTATEEVGAAGEVLHVLLVSGLVGDGDGFVPVASRLAAHMSSVRA